MGSQEDMTELSVILYICKYTHIHTHIHTYTHIHIHTYAYTHRIGDSARHDWTFDVIHI
jgi:hypothetical protein